MQITHTQQPKRANAAGPLPSLPLHISRADARTGYCQRRFGPPAREPPTGSGNREILASPRWRPLISTLRGARALSCRVYIKAALRFPFTPRFSSRVSLLPMLPKVTDELPGVCLCPRSVSGICYRVTGSKFPYIYARVMFVFLLPCVSSPLYIPYLQRENR